MTSIESDLDLLAFGLATGVVIGALLLLAARLGYSRLQTIAFPLAAACGTTVREFQVRFEVGEGLLVVGATLLMLLSFTLGSVQPPIDLRAHRFSISVVCFGIWVGPPETDFAPIVLGASIGLLLLAPRIGTTESVIVVDYSVVVLLAIVGGAGFTRETAGALAGLVVPLILGIAFLVIPEPNRGDRVVLAVAAAWHIAVVGVAARGVAADQAGIRGWPSVVATVLIGGVVCGLTWVVRSRRPVRSSGDQPA